jgi:CheY-like chemotaxis protein
MKNIILIDDDEINNFIVPKLIRTIYPEIEVKKFIDPFEALYKLSESEITPETIVLLDLNMPLMDGWQFLEQLAEKNLKCNVFILTSSENPFDLEHSKKNELVKGFFTKPMTIENVKQIFSTL